MKVSVNFLKTRNEHYMDKTTLINNSVPGVKYHFAACMTKYNVQYEHYDFLYILLIPYVICHMDCF